MTRPSLSVEPAVVDQTLRLALLDVPGIARLGRGGPRWRNLFAGAPLTSRTSGGRLNVRVWVVARSGEALTPLAARVQAAVGGAVEQLLGMEIGTVTVLIDGVGG